MTTDRTASLAEPILICGILGGMVGGLNCCCWFAPAASSFLAVKWARNLRGPTANVTGAGIRAAILSALLMAAFGTAVYLYLNVPSRMSVEQQAFMQAMLGDSGMADVPVGGLAFGHALIASTMGMVLGFLGALAAGGGAQRPPRPPQAAPTPAAPAAPVAPAAPAAPAAPPPTFGSASRFLDAAPEDFASTPSEEQAWSDPDEE